MGVGVGVVGCVQVARVGPSSGGVEVMGGAAAVVVVVMAVGVGKRGG